ncbi:MAG: hypothetical protein K9L85_01340 [Candidatus Peribacteraceae bacterium]|nr:hypothetical protein [Candidatus Peribacteraceae bacterium]
MKLSHLTEIVKNVAAVLKCPKCGKHFVSDAVDVVDITGDRGLFSGHCLHCNSATLVAMNIREFRQKIAKREKQISKVALGKIAPADVVEMKNFLEDFDGDFRKVLEQTDRKKRVE